MSAATERLAGPGAEWMRRALDRLGAGPTQWCGQSLLVRPRPDGGVDVLIDVGGGSYAAGRGRFRPAAPMPAALTLTASEWAGFLRIQAGLEAEAERAAEAKRRARAERVVWIASLPPEIAGLEVGEDGRLYDAGGNYVAVLPATGSTVAEIEAHLSALDWEDVE